jgi:hypothetical protein
MKYELKNRLDPDRYSMCGCYIDYTNKKKNIYFNTYATDFEEKVEVPYARNISRAFCKNPKVNHVYNRITQLKALLISFNSLLFNFYYSEERDEMYVKIVEDLIKSSAYSSLFQFLEGNNLYIDFKFDIFGKMSYKVEDMNNYSICTPDNRFSHVKPTLQALIDDQYIYTDQFKNILSNVIITNNPFLLFDKSETYSNSLAKFYYLYDCEEEMNVDEFLDNLYETISYSFKSFVTLKIKATDPSKVNRNTSELLTALGKTFYEDNAMIALNKETPIVDLDIKKPEFKWDETLSSMYDENGGLYNTTREILQSIFNDLKLKCFNQMLTDE